MSPRPHNASYKRFLPLWTAAAVLAAALWSASIYTAATAGPESSRPESIKGAVDAYMNRQYKKSLSLLDSAPAADRSNSYTRYYRALCLQKLNQLEAASKEYYWLYKNSKNAQLRYKAWQGLKTIGQYKTTRSNQGQSDNIESAKPPARSTGDAAALRAKYKKASQSDNWAVPGKGYGASGPAPYSHSTIIVRPKPCGR